MGGGRWGDGGTLSVQVSQLKSVSMTYLSTVPVSSQKCFGLDNKIDGCLIKYMVV